MFKSHKKWYISMLTFCVWVFLKLPTSHSHQIWIGHVWLQARRLDVNLHTWCRPTHGVTIWHRPGPYADYQSGECKTAICVFSPFASQTVLATCIPLCFLNFSKVFTCSFVYIHRQSPGGNFNGDTFALFVSRKSSAVLLGCAWVSHICL